MNSPHSFGELLQRSMHRQGLSPEQLAAHSDINAKTIRALTSGAQRPRSSTVKTLAEKLGLEAGSPDREEFEQAALAVRAAQEESDASAPDEATSLLIADKTQDFTGREHLFAAIDAFVRHQPSGYFLLQGDPGAGKSAFLAEYVKRTGCIAHFNIRSLGITTTGQFLQHICTQLITRYHLPYPSVPAEELTNGAFFARLLSEASRHSRENAPVILAVDALDEVDLALHQDGSNILFLPPTLPVGVYLILTKRNVTLPFTTTALQVTYDLNDHRSETQQDVSRYLSRTAEREALRARLTLAGVTPDSFIALLTDKSEGNFMYLRYVLPEIEQGVYTDLQLRDVPVGLEGYYADHWRRMGMTANPLPRLKIRTLYLLCETREPISIRLLVRFARFRAPQGIVVDELAVQEIIETWRQFLHQQRSGPEKRYSLYHTSFQEFLHRTDIIQQAEVTLAGITALMADVLWDEVFPDEWGE